MCEGFRRFAEFLWSRFTKGSRGEDSAATTILGIISSIEADLIAIDKLVAMIDDPSRQELFRRVRYIREKLYMIKKLISQKR